MLCDFKVIKKALFNLKVRWCQGC